MKKIILISLFLLALTNAYSQNITNTLGASGLFSIKDGSTTFMSLSQSTGNFSLLRNLELGGVGNSISIIGVVTKNGERFIHSYQAQDTYGYNTFIGINSGNFTMSGTLNEASFNTAVGYQTLNSLTSGYYNSAFGSTSLYSNTTGEQNSAFGDLSLYSNTIGFGNSAIGRAALYLNTTGNYNTALGGAAGSTITTGSNLICIGFQSEPTSGSAIGQITLGNGSITILRCNTQTITSLSDMRDKKNITDLSLGLDFITKLKPRQFNWDRRDWYKDGISDGSKMQETPTAGFIAQELDEVQNDEHAEWLNLVLKDNPDKWEATYGNLLPVMVKAIQELNEKNEQLKIKNQNLEERLAKYEETQSIVVKKLEEIESGEELFKFQLVKSENNNQ